MKRVSLSRFLLSLVSGIAALTLMTSSAFAAKICLDPGHGGSDSGATGNGLLEKNVNLDVTNRFKTWLDKDTADGAGGGSWSVVRTRSTDVYVSLQGRCDIANNNGANRFMCTHSNAFNGSAHGIETFCYGSGSSNSFDLRNKVYQEAIAMWPLTPRGTKTANFYVLIHTNMPAELHEMGFIDNAGDAVYLGSASHRDNQARSQLYAIQRHYGYAKYTPQTGVNIIVDNTSGNFSASSNWWTGAYGNYYGSNYHVRGTEAVSDAANWAFNIPSGGAYKVYAWWSDGANRTSNIAYMIYHTGGQANVYVNQQANGGQWNYLGQYNFNSGTNNIKLSCWATAGYFVIADAIRVTNQ